MLEIGRQTRRTIYDINVTKTAPLVSAEGRFGVAERLGPHGETISPLRPKRLSSIRRLRGEAAIVAAQANSAFNSW